MLEGILASAALALTLLLVGELVRRSERAHHQDELARLEQLHVGERTRLVERVTYLEFQLANHMAHVLKLPPPAPPARAQPKPEPLPEVIEKFLDAIDEEEARLEFESEFRARLSLGADPHQLVNDALTRV